MKDLNIVFAGFGGQGILFAGKVVAYAGLIEGRELSWLPSYGPEMRGGTANCSICLSDEPIGSPLVTNPNVLIAMNRPSLDKFVNEVEPGGTILLDSSLIDERVERDDVTVFYVPASKLAEENGLKGLANIILVGKLRKEHVAEVVAGIGEGCRQAGCWIGYHQACRILRAVPKKRYPLSQ